MHGLDPVELQVLDRLSPFYTPCFRLVDARYLTVVAYLGLRLVLNV